MKGEKCGIIFICHSERSVAKSSVAIKVRAEQVYLLCRAVATKRNSRISSLGVPLSAVYITRRSLGRLGMTYYTNRHASQTPYFSLFTFHFSLFTLLTNVVAVSLLHFPMFCNNATETMSNFIGIDG